MPDDTTIDPFKPAQPAIPGLPPDKVKAKLSPPAPAVYAQSAPERKAPLSPMVWVAITVLAAFSVLAVAFSYWMRNSTAEATGLVSSSGAALSSLLPPRLRPSQNLPTAPGPIATTGELPKAWSSKRFLFRDPVTSQIGPALVVRLPGGEYWGFSLREPYGDCQLELVTDVKKLKTEYSLNADHPMVADPCNHTIYDLLRYGGGAGDSGLVRGEIVQGNGIRPPIAIQIQVKGKDVIAARVE